MGSDIESEKLPVGWEITTLGEIVRRAGGKIQTGPFGSQLHASDYVEVGIPSIMPINIGDGRIVENGIARVSKEDAQRLSRHRVAVGDVVYSRRGDVERHALIEPEQAGWLCGTGCIKVNLGRGVVIPRFASFFLRHPVTREWITRHAVGATMPNLNTSIMSQIPFIIPPLETQRRIANILGTLDDRIELNRRMNRTLEGMAAAIFKSWFIDFDPVRAKAEGRDPALPKHLADLFPNTFQDSPLGPIPEGWSCSTIGDEFNLTMGQSPPGETYNEMREGTPFFQGRRDFGFRFPTNRVYCTAPTRYAARGDTLMSVRAPVGDVNIAIDRCSIGRGVAAARHKSSSVSYTYYAFRSLRQRFDVYNGEGTVFGSISQKALRAIPWLAPPDEIIAQFDHLASPIDQRIELNELQNRRLAALRDTLLPKLLSGEIDESVLEQVEVP